MVTFDHTIPTSLPPAELWRLLTESFEDSVASPLWPSDLEELRCPRLRQGARVRATYKLGPLRARQSYDIPECDPERRVMRYATRSGHPLRGGGRVIVEESGEGSRLRWSGEYARRLHPGALATELFIEYYFEERFFDAIARNLRTIEREQTWREGADGLREAKATPAGRRGDEVDVRGGGEAGRAAS